MLCGRINLKTFMLYAFQFLFSLFFKDLGKNKNLHLKSTVYE